MIMMRLLLIKKRQNQTDLADMNESVQNRSRNSIIKKISFNANFYSCYIYSVCIVIVVYLFNDNKITSSFYDNINNHLKIFII